MKDSTWLVTPLGQLTDEITFPEAPLGATEIIVDLGQIDYINSTGVRCWLQWLKSLTPQAAQTTSVAAGQSTEISPQPPAITSPPGDAVSNRKIVLRRAPLAFLRLMGFINEMIPKTALLDSFFISYSCLDCAKVHNVEVTNSSNLGSTCVLLANDSTPLCSACQFETELEIAPSFYRGLGSFAPKPS